MKANNLCEISGKKIRRQYFNIFIYLELMLAFVPVSIILVANSLWGKSGTKLSSFYEYILTVVLVFFIFMLPFIILSLFNKKHFGKIICVLCDDGIKYNNGFISWDCIKCIEYEIRIRPFIATYNDKHCYANVICEDKTIKLRQAPYLLLHEIKKEHPDILMKFGKTCLQLLAFAIGTPICIAIFLAIKLCI